MSCIPIRVNLHDLQCLLSAGSTEQTLRFLHRRFSANLFLLIINRANPGNNPLEFFPKSALLIGFAEIKN
ncbi:hypothetical protein A3J20_05510 [Candidatus Gottesmanbacteria bacterium RIFCSPLOWO2_02_FULL_42_29]|uniref:Uncharacterized protein n=1 Tax=Candidatus Gottesmanbacteria bacterium RIFCSPLOWO2_01_FULL_42_22 TaxID=1798391 RepID=A0A1F6BGF5_9BACT|nr:MAG: hypothetical protein A2781_02365 [Candidatus Gottesmanbacteria bacterium RIFCSPHIGHO2_01_FULL_42_27]OGG22421.1 MAG: hypothetical protein A3E72_01040 [Candidatus Gottesmanbacteria bacterium RIFCSPHIGHO2_12_FULL_43_26]OGG32992.1 MAG: hypothetical protein A3G68_06905 [Candidatus Gottesmanbacteria bacterium RIFCSPLOWO2_12_FULL_42_10]OGG35958.1 MAG: hypothetical protein A2968_03565 [Candidatus Gottesmanbacteria bacterium RIFCSPLOWO2_01_FULL_42_22]OGG39364.1 MAG: hypothetical protein A3J20_05